MSRDDGVTRLIGFPVPPRSRRLDTEPTGAVPMICTRSESMETDCRYAVRFSRRSGTLAPEMTSGTWGSPATRRDPPVELIGTSPVSV